MSTFRSHQGLERVCEVQVDIAIGSTRNGERDCVLSWINRNPVKCCSAKSLSAIAKVAQPFTLSTIPAKNQRPAAYTRAKIIGGMSARHQLPPSLVRIFRHRSPVKIRKRRPTDRRLETLMNERRQQPRVPSIATARNTGPRRRQLDRRASPSAEQSSTLKPTHANAAASNAVLVQSSIHLAARRTNLSKIALMSKSTAAYAGHRSETPQTESTSHGRTRWTRSRQIGFIRRKRAPEVFKA